LRDDIDQFTQAGAQVVTIAPDTPDSVQRFVNNNEYPFPLLSDSEHAVFDAYDVVNTMMSLGQRPALFVIDRDGTVRFDSIGTQQWQIPTNANVLRVVAGL
jgi:peroxiredoxin Q/BCP